MLFASSHRIILQFIVLTLLVFSCGQVPSLDSEQLVIGGKQSHAPSYFVGLHAEGAHAPFCGGSLIGENLVITAAHCVNQVDGPLAAWIAIEDLKKPPEPRRIEAIRVHPRYHAGLLQHDLALLTLEPEKETKGPAISLATDTQTNGQASLRIYGFGNTERIGHAYPQKIRTAALAEIPNYRCQTLNGPYNLILEEQVCAGDWEKGRRDACDGDSGGPLVLEGETDKLYGLVSWGVGCGQARSPGVYTRITSYADWIDRERKALGSLPIEELAQAVFYFPLFETPSTQLQESQRRFTAGHHIWKRTESPSRGESRGLWRRLLGDEELTLELFRGDGDQYELRLNYQGKVYETQATYQDLRKVK